MLYNSETKSISQKHIATVDLTPDYARELLSLNVNNNRLVSKSIVKRYSSDMLSGMWEDNGETIKLDENGNLIDGQHRLLAVIESGVTITTTIVTGIKTSAFRTIDRGRQRTVSDTFKIDGEQYAALLAAMVAWLWRWENRNPVPKQPSVHLTTTKAKELLDHNPSLRDSAALISSHNKYLIGMCNSSIVGIAHFLFSDKNRSRADEFVIRLCKGNDLSENHPILKARERMRTMKGQRAQYPDYDYLAINIMAWNNFSRGKNEIKQRIYWHEARGGFPEPK